MESSVVCLTDKFREGKKRVETYIKRCKRPVDRLPCMEFSGILIKTHLKNMSQLEKFEK